MDNAAWHYRLAPVDWFTELKSHHRATSIFGFYQLMEDDSIHNHQLIGKNKLKENKHIYKYVNKYKSMELIISIY